MCIYAEIIFCKQTSWLMLHTCINMPLPTVNLLVRREYCVGTCLHIYTGGPSTMPELHSRSVRGLILPLVIYSFGESLRDGKIDIMVHDCNPRQEAQKGLELNRLGYIYNKIFNVQEQIHTYTCAACKCARKLTCMQHTIC